jgi:hypothetical protein
VGKHLVLLHRLGDVRGGEHPVFFPAGAGQAVEIDGSGVGRMGREPEAAQPLGMFFEKAQRAEQRFILVDPRADIDQFQEPPGAQGRDREMRQQFRESLDIGHRRDPALGQHLEPFGDRVDVIPRGERPPQRVDRLDPLREALPRADRALEPGEVEMAMGVDQARQKRARAKIRDRLAGLGGQLRSRPHRDNFRSLHPHRATSRAEEKRSIGAFEDISLAAVAAILNEFWRLCPAPFKYTPTA